MSQTEMGGGTSFKGEHPQLDDTKKVTAKKENLKVFVFGFLGLLAVVLVGLFGFTIYRVYASTPADQLSMTVARALRLPAFKLNGEVAHYSDYIDDLAAIRVMREYDKANNGPGANLTEEQMSDQVLLRLVNNILVGEAAKKYNLTVDDKDIADVKSKILSQFKTLADADSELQKRYGWNMQTYEIKVMRPYVLQNKLADKVQTDDAMRADVLKRAQDVLQQIKAGGDFAELAKKYGEDGTAAAGGDLGWFGKGEMVPQFEEAAFALKKAETSATLVETPYGYHIIRVDDKRVTKTKDAKGKTVSKDEIKARHILFTFPSLSKYLDNMLRQATFHLYIRVHNPLADKLKQ